jgi:hypothetical protein
VRYAKIKPLACLCTNAQAQQHALTVTLNVTILTQLAVPIPPNHSIVDQTTLNVLLIWLQIVV